MANWNTIEELKNIFIDEYITTKLGSKLENACNDEYELMRDYNGRQILELLQNVDDACSRAGMSNNEVLVKINFKDNILEVGNTGTAFSQETIERLCQGKASNKSSENIGNKGTGFRSLLNDAEWIEVHSGDFSVRFSEKYAREQFEKYVDKSSVLQSQVQGWKKEYKLCFPIMHCPEQIKKMHSEFDTLIRVKIKDENRNKEVGILNQLRQPFYKSLLFLPNITQIEIAIDDEVRMFKKLPGEGKIVLISDSQNTLNIYYVEEKKNVSIYENKVANLIIAVPLDENYDFSTEKLYCYFPIRNFKTPVNALIHAPFLTNSSRDDIPNDNEQINKKIFEECLKFLKEVAENIVNDESLDIEDLAIKTVTPTDKFTGMVWDKDSFNLNTFYLQLLENAKLLPTVNKIYVSINDNPKCFDFNFPEAFKGDAFKELLKQLPYNEYEFVKRLAATKNYRLDYTVEEVREKINLISDSLDVTQQVKIFLWWSEHYRDSRDLPRLLKDTTGKWISSDTKIYLPTDTGISILPESLSWVNLCILGQCYVDELVNQIKLNYRKKWDEANSKLKAERITSKRTLNKVSDDFPVQFIEQSQADLVSQEINRQVDTNEKAVTFIRWIYENYNNQVQPSSSSFDLNYKLPDRDGNLRQTKELFFGKEYGNKYDLSEKIFGFDKSKFAVADFDTLFKGFENEREEILDFLRRCGVSAYPKIFRNDTLNYKSRGFLKHIEVMYNPTININYLSAMYIDDFEQLVSSLDTKEITQWITDDLDLYNLITLRGKEGYYSYRNNTYKYPIYSNEYILYVLNTTKWIKIGEKKYSPKDIVKYPKLKDKIDGIYGISEQDLIKELGNKAVVQDMGLDFVPSLAAFPDNIIHKILLKLPDFDFVTGEISRALYEDIIKLKTDKQPEYSTADLRLLATDGNFYDNTILRYSRSRLPKAMSNSIRLIHIPTKRSMSTIKDWLGVERYEINFELIDYRTILHLKDFTNELSDIKIVALAILDEIKDANSQIVKRLKIIPCESILVRDIENGNTEIELDDYNYIKNDGKYYIKVPVNAAIEQIRGSLDFRTSVWEIFEAAMERKLDQNKFEYLLLNDSQGKKSIIDSEYGIDKWGAVYEILYQRSIINERVLEFFKANSLSVSLIENIKDIDFSSSLSAEDFTVLKAALKEVGRDIKDINGFDERLSINIRPCIKEEFSKYRNSKVDIYRINCYNCALKSEKAQKSFLRDCNEFILFEPNIDSIENTIYIDYDKIIKEKFVKYDWTVNCSKVDADALYSQNYEFIISKGFSRDILDFYLETHVDVKSTLYFRVPENVFDDLTEFSKAEDEKTAENSTQTDLTNDNSDVKGSIVETKLLPASSSSEDTPHVKSEKSQKQYEYETANKERAGKKAEQIAYKELKKKYPKLIWHSKNSDKPADKNRGPVNIVCDMWNPNSDNKEKYFEIKSATTEFEMSINEYVSMENNKDKYFVVLVDIATGEMSLHQFDELIKLIQVSKYRFCFKQIK